MTNRTAEEVLSEYVKDFGPKDGPIVRNLTDKVSDLALRWRVFLYFFCGPRERVDAMSEASGSTTRLIQCLLWDNTLMRIRQLTDPATTGNNDNLSLKHLVRIAKDVRDVDLSEVYVAMLKSCSTSRTYATKWLAHLDLAHSLGDENSEITRGESTKAIRAICEFVQEFHSKARGTHYLIAPTMPIANEQQFLLRLFQGNQTAKDLEAATKKARYEGSWQPGVRTDIPDWVFERHGPLDLF
jgi:hypothetical protein